MINIEKYAKNLNKFLENNNINYFCEEILNETNQKIYIYVCDPEICVMIGVPKKKFIGYIWNNALAQRWEKEGFTLEEIEKECPAWVQVRNFEELLTMIEYKNRKTS